ncbi:MAG: Spy/CpxP family protein refolding chaperone [Cyanobacteriota/Melainabacteria group bacterium]
MNKSKRLSSLIATGIFALSGCAAAAQEGASSADSAKATVPLIMAEDVVIDNYLSYSPDKKNIGRGSMHGFPGDIGGLKLTDEQMEKAVEARIKAAKRAAPLKVELMELKHELTKVMSAESIDTAKAKELHGLISEKMQAMGEIHFEVMLDMASNLTADQKKKMKHKILLHEFLSPFPGVAGPPGFPGGPGRVPPPFMGPSGGPMGMPPPPPGPGPGACLPGTGPGPGAGPGTGPDTGPDSDYS